MTRQPISLENAASGEMVFGPDFLARFTARYLAAEDDIVPVLLAEAQLAPDQLAKAQAWATNWVSHWRSQKRAVPKVAEMLNQFGLSSAEGVALMCLAEALLRIPDAATADALIADKLSGTDWQHQIQDDPHWLMNAATWALAVTGDLVRPHGQQPGDMLHGLLNKLGAPVVRQALRTAMAWMADQFVYGETIDRALERGAKEERPGLRVSYDMLGEGARTAEDAERFHADYLNAIQAVGESNRRQAAGRERDFSPAGISVKLSALHPRYEFAQKQRVMDELVPRLVQLAEAAAQADMMMIVDAEEADRQFLSLEVIELCLRQARLGRWNGFGLAVQAYSKTAPLIIEALDQLSQQLDRTIVVRLIKGAYWDTEIKRAQERGLMGFPVYTRKETTDVAYLACAKKLLACPRIKPVFGSHNAMTIASVLALAPDATKLEFQRLHGMGEEIDDVLATTGATQCIYAPVGAHRVLLGYLVRRLLENGANSSFVHRLYDQSLSVNDLLKDPCVQLREAAHEKTIGTLRYAHPAVVRPEHIFLPRKNSVGFDLSNPLVVQALDRRGQNVTMGQAATEATPEDVQRAHAEARAAWPQWQRTHVFERARVLENLADLIEQNAPSFIYLLQHEAFKTWPDCVAEIREAVDFCRYYAAQAQPLFVAQRMPGITGEDNIWQVEGRGVFVAISPWNFPLAIFLGQMAAALVAGNAVLAKPAPQTPRLAQLTVQLAHQAGVPAHVLQLLCGGRALGEQLTNLQGVAGVVFTGSTTTARQIARTLAAHNGPLPVLIAETGGINAMVVDSTALPEQVCDDVLTSGFRSAGQRCSALRLLCVPRSTAHQLLPLIAGAMAQLTLGPAHHISTDVGPVIDATAKQRLEQHLQKLQREAKLIYACNPPEDVLSTVPNIFPPQLWEISHTDWLTEEVFGPIVHVVRYDDHKIDDLIQQLNSKGYGLTFGLHTRISTTARRVAEAACAGNIYINRNMIGAVVGSQPFGGHGLSGTGPKAGGQLYLTRFVQEKLVCTNTTAAGGNASLMMAAGKKTSS